MSKSGSERHVLQNASVLDKFCRRGCREQHKADYSRFMAECVGSDNQEALLCLGIEDYFYGDHDEGIQNLRSVADNGVRKKGDVRECRNMVKFVMDNNMWVNSDRGTRLEKKNKRRCGCVRKLKSFSKNPDYEWLSREKQVAEVADNSLCDSCFWEFEASVFVEICER
ncbi:hypothetical protein LINPERHAP2_LOCUS35961 [Linum perenne]